MQFSLLTLALAALPSTLASGPSCEEFGTVKKIDGRQWQYYCNTALTIGDVKATYPRIKSKRGCMKACGKFVPAPVGFDSPEIYMNFGNYTNDECICYSTRNQTETVMGNAFGMILLPE